MKNTEISPIQEQIAKALLSLKERAKFTEAILAKRLRETAKIDQKKKACIALSDLEKAIDDITKYESFLNSQKYIDYPDKKNGNTILVAHSGSSYLGYFKNLYKLQKGDECKIEYNGKTYIYKIDSIYKKPKTGKIAIYRDYSKTTLTLITCTRNSNTKQTVYVAYLEDIR